MNPNDRNPNQQQQQQSNKSDSGKNAVLPSDNSGNQGNNPKHGSDTNPGQGGIGGKDKDKQRDVNAPGTGKDGSGMKASPDKQGSHDSNRR